MAIYHLNMSHGSIKGGQSARAKLDYISRDGKYKKREDLCRLVESSNLPSWAKDQKHFWGAADDNERANARLFSELEFALPVELNQEQQLNLVRSFAQEQLPKQPYTFAIHEGKGENPHCHLIYSERMDDGIERDEKTFFKRANSKNPELGGAKKNRSLKEKSFLIDTRAKWADAANAALLSAKPMFRKAVQIDHRTLKAQGIDREPQVHRWYKLDEQIRRKLIFNMGVNNGNNRERQIKGSSKERRRYAGDIEQSVKRISTDISTIRKQAQHEDRSRSSSSREAFKRRSGAELQKLNEVIHRGSRRIEEKNGELGATIGGSIRRSNHQINELCEQFEGESRKESSRLEGMGREISERTNESLGRIRQASGQARECHRGARQTISHLQGSAKAIRTGWERSLRRREQAQRVSGEIERISNRTKHTTRLLEQASRTISAIISGEATRSISRRIGEIIKPALESFKRTILPKATRPIKIEPCPELKKAEEIISAAKLRRFRLPSIKTGKQAEEKRSPSRNPYQDLQINIPQRQRRQEASSGVSWGR